MASGAGRLNELLIRISERPMKDGRPALEWLAEDIWDEALDGEKYAIELICAALAGMPTEHDQEQLSKELQQMVDLVYDNGLPPGVEGGGDTST